MKFVLVDYICGHIGGILFVYGETDKYTTGSYFVCGLSVGRRYLSLYNIPPPTKDY